MAHWYVYILKCDDDSNYVGCTSNIDNRMARHQSGKVKSTAYRKPFEIVTVIKFNNKYSAFNFEKYLKSGSGRAFMKKRLI